MGFFFQIQNLSQPQQVQKAAATRVLTTTKKVEHITTVLIFLHWLPLSQRIVFKMYLRVYKALNCFRFICISDFPVHYEPSKCMRLSGTGLLRIQTTHGKQLLVSMLLACGWSFLSTWGLLQLSAHYNQNQEQKCCSFYANLCLCKAL